MSLGHPARAAAVVLAAPLGALTGFRAAVPGTPPPTYDGLLVWLAGWAVALGAGWLGLVAAAVALDALLAHVPGRGARWSRALPVPAAWRRLVLLLCGVAAASTVAVPAPADARRAPAPASAAAAGLPLPSRPAGREAPPVDRARVVVVRPGDSLWRLAAAALPTAASAGRAADLVARTYAANRAVIGADPDLLQPGTRLALPLYERHRR